MKYINLIALLILTTATFAQKNSGLQFPNPDKTTINNLNTVNDNWLAEAQEVIKEAEFAIKQNKNVGSFYTSNLVQHLGFNISALGYEVLPQKISGSVTSSATWNQSLSFESIVKGTSKIAAGTAYKTVQGEAYLRYDYPQFSIEYLNNKSGLRQNFIITEKPAGNSNLELLLNINGDLNPIVINNGLEFKDKNGKTKLFYTDLKVWDANKMVVKATMQLRNNNTLAIVVEDKDAIYPLTIDPLNKTPEWTSSADGLLPGLVGQLAVDAAYGFTVAGLGDVNGDGFDDVAIGAPATADVISGSGTLSAVGAVFIYYGSPTGLPTTASSVLQPTTAVTGALFGYSIAGGDINNDGKNDIIIGAPLDQTNISIGGGNTASGTVGKVYVYNGATLTSGSTPLLTLQLNGSGILENGINLSVNALFGFSVSVTEDLNNDGKKDIIVGSPTYAGIKKDIFNNSSIDVQSGGAFVFLSNGASHNLVKLDPIKTGILGLPILQSNINGLLFGYSVDGLGDYNGDGRSDVVVSAPAGVDLSSLNALLTGKLLQGSAIVYYGTAAGIDTDAGASLVATSGGLLTNIVGSISNVANMFGVSVKGIKNANGIRNGNVMVGAPLGGALMSVLTLQLKTGTVSIFKKKASSPSASVVPDQILTSPRNSNNILELIQSNLLFGFSLDNTYDINCDGYSDIIVGEPASSGLQLLGTSIGGGAAYVYLGKADGTYETSAFWSITATEDAFLGVNATSLIGYSVAGAGHVRGASMSNKILIGTPSRTLDFGAGLLNLGNTLGTLFSLAAGDNGVGKSYLFDLGSPCIGSPVTNPDFNSSFVNVSVSGNTNTNDRVPIGTSYDSALLVNGVPGSTPVIIMNSDGTYSFITDKPGVYEYNVPVCTPEVIAPCPPTKLTITVLDQNINTNAPVANVDIATTKINTAVTIKTLANDAAGNSTSILVPSSVTVINAPLHGTTSVNSTTGDITYTPAANYTGSDTLTYQVCDNQNPAKCTIAKQIITTMSAANPNTTTAADDYIKMELNTVGSGNVKTNDIDAEGNTQTVTAQTSNIPGKGTLTLLANGSYTFVPDANFTGPVDFIYTTCDDGTPQACSNATLHILVSPKAPFTNPDFNTTFINVPVPGKVNTNDFVPSGSTYGTPILQSSPVGSSPTISMNSDGSYIFKSATPGIYTYDVPVCTPGQLAPCPNTKLVITVLDATIITNAPVANVDIATTNLNTDVTLKTLANDAASYGTFALNPSTVTVIAAPSNGTVSINSATGDITYTPSPGFAGRDTLTYQVCDNQPIPKCVTANQIITTLPASSSNTTTAADDYLVTFVNTAKSGNVKTNDKDAEANFQTVTAQTTNLPGKGILQLASDGSYTFTPDIGFTGPADFIYTTCDDGTPQACASATLHILIQPTFGLPDLTPKIYNDSLGLAKDSTRDNVIRITNIGSGQTVGTIYFTIPKMLPAFIITIDPNATTVDVAGGTAVTNADWTITEQSTRYVFMSKPGMVLTPGEWKSIGLKIKAAGIKHSTGNLSIQIILGTGGGETPFVNNNDNNTYIIN